MITAAFSSNLMYEPSARCAPDFVRTTTKVKVIAGKDKGKEGVVIKAFPANDRVIVKGVNIVKKHQKPNNANPNGVSVT